MVNIAKQSSTAFSRPLETTLGLAVSKEAIQNEGKSGFMLIDKGREAYWQHADEASG